MKLALITLIMVTFSYGNSIATENISIETKNDNFFANVVSDSLLLLDPDLRRIVADDFDYVVSESKFNVQVNSWKPRPSPKKVLVDIYNDMNKNNIKRSFAFAVQPIVELACTRQNDQLKELQSKCIKDLFKYPIIHTIQFKYVYEPNITIEQNINELSNLNDKDRYQFIVLITADIMNRAFARVLNKKVVKDVLVVKYPLEVLAVSPDSVKPKEKGEDWYQTKQREEQEFKAAKAKELERAGGREECWDQCRSDYNACTSASSSSAGCSKVKFRCTERCDNRKE